MFTPQDFIDTIKQEGEILKHLATKIPGDPSNFRLAPNGRTTLELMQYLTIAGIGCATFTKTGNFDHFPAISAEAQNVNVDNFAVAIDKQTEAIVAFMEATPESDFTSKTCTMPWGGEYSLGRGLVMMTQTFLSAYRLELFLHAKAAGNTEIGTSNAWIGMDKPAEG